MTERDRRAFVVIEVGDTGSGMSPETRERAFEPFFTTKQAGHGTGLGLAQVATFVKDAGGLCRLDSEPGGGTTVRLFLPAACDDCTGRADPTLEVQLGLIAVDKKFRGPVQILEFPVIAIDRETAFHPPRISAGPS